jgi:hypothetical protein
MMVNDACYSLNIRIVQSNTQFCISKNWPAFLTILSVLLSISSCINKSENSSGNVINSHDTLIRSEMLITPIAGSASNSERFYLVIKNDTSDFTCLINTSTESGTYSLNISFYASNISYEERLKELEIILPHINKKYPLDSLRSIYMGRLIYYGNLAVAITEAYHREYTSYKNVEDYQAISTFLLKTKLANDFNKILKPYGVSIQKISPEKIFFADKKELLLLSKVTHNQDSISDKILDCMLWLGVSQ